MRAVDSDGGSASVEIVLLTPLLVLLLAVAFVAGRLVLARQDVVDASRSALEAAITAPGGSQAITLAKSTATDVLSSDGVCSRVNTSGDARGFSAGGTFSVTVTCVVSLPSLAFLPFPKSVSLTATRQGPVEPFREIER